MHGAFFLGAFFFFRRRRRQKRIGDKPSHERGDLTHKLGTFLVCKSGVTVNLSRPLNRFSHHFQWEQVPIALAKLKLILGGDGDWAASAFALMSEQQKDELEDALLSWGGTQEIWDWVPELAKRCPNPSVAHRLEKLAVLNADELDKFIMR